MLNTTENVGNGLLNKPKKILEVGEKRGDKLKTPGSEESNGSEFPGFSFDHVLHRFTAKQASSSEMTRTTDQKISK